jgi:thiamine kinase-like enzyme
LENIPIGTIDEVTPQWLTRVLQEGGYLTRGTVSALEIRSQDSNWASNALLRLSYSVDALGEMPAKLFLKICNPGEGTFGDSEIIYYSIVSPEISDSPIPRCYHSAFNKALGSYHLLLEDLSDTHVPDIEPTWELAAGRMASLAQLHAAWWNHPRLGLVGEFPDRKKLDKYVAYARAGLAPMLEEVGDVLPREWLDLVDKIFALHRKKMIERVGNGKDLTCIHGDLNPGNILSPLKVGEKTYLIDRQPFDWSLTVWLGVSDLTYMIVHWWAPEMRRAWERPLLEIYHRHLVRLGIRDYTFEQLWMDYRLCAMQSLYVPCAWCVRPVEREAARELWWSQLQKTMAACLDLNCIDLLE